MHPAESKVHKFHKWQFVKRFGTDPKAAAWAHEYADLMESGRKMFVNSSMPYEAWVSLSASSPTVEKMRNLADYVSYLQAKSAIAQSFKF